MSSIFLASDFNNWITRINAVRSKNGIDLSSLTLSVQQNELAKSSTMSSLKTEILGMKTQTYLAYADYTKIEAQTISTNTPIKQSQKDDIESTVVSLENICPNNSTTNATNTTNATATNTTNSTYTDDITSSRTTQTNSTNTTAKNITTTDNYGPGFGGYSNKTTGNYMTHASYQYTGDTTSCKTYSYKNTTNTTWNHTQICNTDKAGNTTNQTTSNSTYTTTKNSTWTNSTNSTNLDKSYSTQTSNSNYTTNGTTSNSTYGVVSS